MRQVTALGKDNFINPYDFQVPADGAYESTPHLLLQGLIPAIVSFLRQLGCPDNFLLDKICTVYFSQSPRLYELV